MAPRYVLFSSGARFGRAVLDELLRLDLPPRLIVLPGYPPARRVADPGADIVAPASGAWPGERFAGRIEYAVRARQAACARRIAPRQIDFLLVACWPWLIGAELAGAVTAAALNLHPSLLPAYRGPRPLAAQLAAGERRFGVTLHRLGPRFDRGDIILQRRLPALAATADETAIEAECARQGARLFARAARDYPDWRPRPQSPDGD